MSDPQVVVLFVDDDRLQNQAVVGTSDTPCEDIDSPTLYLRYCVKISWRETEEGRKAVSFTPLIFSDHMVVDLRHYTGIGPLKSQWADEYIKWRDNYEKHDEIFAQASGEDTHSRADHPPPDQTSDQEVPSSGG